MVGITLARSSSVHHAQNESCRESVNTTPENDETRLVHRLVCVNMCLKQRAPCWQSASSCVFKLIILASIIKLSASLCLSPSGTSSLCFDNQTDPNLANHRMSSDEDDNLDTSPSIVNITKLEDSFEPMNKSYLTSFEPRTSYERHGPHYVRPAGRRKTSKTRYYLQPSSHSYHNHHRKPVSKNSMFIPVAAYSITKHKPKPKKRIGPGHYHPLYHSNRHRIVPSASSVSIRQKRPTTTNVSNLLSSASTSGSANIDVDDDLASSDDDNEENTVASDEETPGEDEYETKKESAVYGYIRKPEVIEFRGQYYYGNGQPIDRYGGQSSEHEPINKYDTKADYDDQHHEAAAMVHDQKHIDHYIPVEYDHFHHDISTTSFLLAKLKKILLIKGITVKGILIATLPLLLVPFLTYLLTPVVIPITANVAAGRRRRKRSLKTMHKLASNSSLALNEQSFLWNLAHEESPTSHMEAKVLLQFIEKVNLDEKSTSKAIANLLVCEGLLVKGDRCLEQLACEFADIESLYASHLERTVTAIILSHLLQNEFVNEKFKKRLRRAGVYGRLNTRKCKHKYPCRRVGSRRQMDRDR